MKIPEDVDKLHSGWDSKENPVFMRLFCQSTASHGQVECKEAMLEKALTLGELF